MPAPYKTGRARTKGTLPPSVIHLLFQFLIFDFSVARGLAQFHQLLLIYLFSFFASITVLAQLFRNTSNNYSLAHPNIK